MSIADFGGIALGRVGPVHPIVVANGARRHGIVVSDHPGKGWYDFKTLWYAKSSYHGPVLIRGTRLDGAGTVTFGEHPQFGFLADPGFSATGPSALRTWPGATWVRSPGCYGFQVDGASFSYHIVIEIRAPQSN